MSISRNPSGFTLVELMIGVLVSAILMTAAYQVMVNQSRVYESQEQTIDMQQSARAALDFMSRELRMGGYGVAAGNDIFSNLVNNDGADPNIDDTTDSITFMANTDYGSLLIIDVDPLNPSIVRVFPAPTATMEFRPGNPLDFLDGEKNFIDGGQTVQSVVYGDPADPDGTPTVLTLASPLSGTPLYPAAGHYATVQPLTISYRVNGGILQRGTSNDGGTTWQWQDLIEDVEDLQFVYAFDIDPDGDTEVDANGIIWAVDSDNSGDLDTQVNADGTTVALGTPVAITGDQAMCLIRAVRVSILVRTAREDRSFPLIGVRPQVEDRAAAGANDQFRRRLLRSVVKIRNLGLRVL